MKDTIKIGIIGYGGMGKWHHVKTGDVECVRFEAAYDIDEKARQTAAEKGLRVYTTLEDILKDSELDTILIATPNEFHCPYAVEAFKAGKNVISEKPVSMSSDELQIMIDSAKEHGKLFSIHQNRRWDDDYRIIKEIYETNAIGKMFSIQSRVMGSRGIPGDWRAKKEHGGGMMLDWGVHLIDQALDMIPEKVTDIYVRMQHVRNAEVDDGFQLFMTFESGLVYLVEVTTATYINLPRWHVSGETGTAIINDWSCEGKIVVPILGTEHLDAKPIKAGAGLTKTMAPRGDETTRELPLPQSKTDSWNDYYSNFAAAIRGGQELLVKTDNVMRVMKIMEATFESEAKNAAIRVDI